MVAALVLWGGAEAGDSESRTVPARVALLHEKGRRRLALGDYAGAMAAASDMLRLQPGNQLALALERDAGGARLTAAVPVRMVDVSGRSEEFVQSVRLESEALRRPTPEAVSSGPVEDAAIRRALDQPFAFEYRDASLRDVARDVAARTGLRIALAPGVREKQPITFGPARVPARSLLRWVVRLNGLSCRRSEDRLLLTAGDALAIEVVERQYDISSMASAPHRAGRGSDTSRTREGWAGDAERKGQGWVTYITRTVAPETWQMQTDVLQERPSYTIQYRNGRLVVVHTPEVHEEIADLLAQFRRALHLQVHVRGRFILMEQGALDALGLEWNYDSLDDAPLRRYRASGSITQDPQVSALSRVGLLANGGVTMLYAYLGDELLSAVLTAVLKERRGIQLAAPRLTCFNTQRAILQSIINYNYIRRVTSDDEPEIGNIPDGIIFDVQPFVSADRRYITLNLEQRVRNLVALDEVSFAETIDDVDTTGAAADAYLGNRLIQIPTSVLRSVGTTVTIPNGGSVLVAAYTEVEEHAGNASVPFLGSLPVVKELVRGWARNEGRRTFMIILSAETVPDLFEEQ